MMRRRVMHSDTYRGPGGSRRMRGAAARQDGEPEGARVGGEGVKYACLFVGARSTLWGASRWSVDASRREEGDQAGGH